MLFECPNRSKFKGTSIDIKTDRSNNCCFCLWLFCNFVCLPIINILERSTGPLFRACFVCDRSAQFIVFYKIHVVACWKRECRVRGVRIEMTGNDCCIVFKMFASAARRTYYVSRRHCLIARGLMLSNDLGRFLRIPIILAVINNMCFTINCTVFVWLVAGSFPLYRPECIVLLRTFSFV